MEQVNAITRARGKMSMTSFAKKLGVTLSAVSQWESGKKTPSLKNYRAIARVTKVPLVKLIGGAP